MNLRDFKYDFAASLVVFLVVLPISMAVATASGSTEAHGLLSAVIGAFVAGFLGGAPLVISGPSAGLSVLLLQMSRDFEGRAHALAMVVVVAALVQLAAGVLRLGRQFQAVSPAVIRGMLAGIGVLIVVQQFHVMLDHAIARDTGLLYLLAIPSSVHDAFLDDGSSEREAALVGLITLVVAFVWDRFKPTRLKILPGPLIAAALAAGFAGLLRLSIRRVEVPRQLGELLTFPDAESLILLADRQVLTSGLALAFVASAETLLCAGAISRVDPRGPRTDYDRELRAQGLGNLLCGVVGTIPIAGVISRSAPNVEAGARTRLSAALVGVWVTVFVLLLPALLNLVPKAALAAILIYIGFKLIDWPAIRELSRFGWPVVFILTATAMGVVCIDLLTGIVVGFVLSSLRLLYQMSHVYFQLEEVGERIELHMHGSATFLGLPKLQEALARVKPKKEVHVHFDQLEFIDHACLDLLAEFRRRYEEQGGTVIVEWSELMGRRQKKSRLVAAEVARPSERHETKDNNV